jgi:hypothetical protein
MTRITRTITASAVAAGLVVGGVAVTAPSSAAPAKHHKPCVTHAEYRRIHHHDSIAKVRRVFGFAGHQTYAVSGDQYSPAMQGRDYRTCAGHYGITGTASIDFTKHGGTWRVTDKSVGWGF